MRKEKPGPDEGIYSRVEDFNELRVVVAKVNGVDIVALVKDGVVEVKVWAIVEIVLMAVNNVERVGVKESRIF